jgi:hypothetical protein
MNSPKPFTEFLRERDAPTVAYEPQTAAEWKAHTRGEFRGQWLALWMLRDMEARGETDLSSALAQLGAGLLALKRRRSPRDFRTALDRHTRDRGSDGLA